MNKHEDNRAPRFTVEQIEREISRRETARMVRKAVSDTVRNLIVIAAAIVLVTNLMLSVMMINKGSMNPTLEDGDVVVAVRWTGANPGDVVAFHYNNVILIKRVIAKAGDWVKIGEDGTVYVNNEALDEPYLTEKNFGDCNIDMPYQIPDGCVFVMGDHRQTSVDSRMKEIGPVKTEDIVGKVYLRIWPLTKLNFFG